MDDISGWTVVLHWGTRLRLVLAQITNSETLNRSGRVKVFVGRGGTDVGVGGPGGGLLWSYTSWQATSVTSIEGFRI